MRVSPSCHDLLPVVSLRRFAGRSPSQLCASRRPCWQTSACDALVGLSPGQDRVASRVPTPPEPEICNPDSPRCVTPLSRGRCRPLHCRSSSHKVAERRSHAQLPHHRDTRERPGRDGPCFFFRRRFDARSIADTATRGCEPSLYSYSHTDSQYRPFATLTRLKDAAGCLIALIIG
jgi:hypothetical protein